MLHRRGVEPIGFLELALLVGLPHQPLLAIQKVSGLGSVAFFDTLRYAPTKWIVFVAGLQCRTALPLVRALVLREPLSRVVLVALLPLSTRFLLRMPLRRVAHLGVDGLRARREGPQVRVLGKLVVTVVTPGAGLMPAACSVVHCVVAVLLTG